MSAAVESVSSDLLTRVGDVEGHAHFKLASGEQLLVWTPESSKKLRPLIVYLHGASPRGEDVRLILSKGPNCIPKMLSDGDLKFDVTVDDSEEESRGSDLKQKRAELREARSSGDAGALQRPP